MQRDLVFGKTPQANVERRFQDANDRVGRVAGQLLERLLNTDILRDNDSFSTAAAYALQDYQLPGFGLVKLAYRARVTTKKGKPPIMGETTGSVLAPAVPDSLVKAEEDVETEYIYWKDVLWSPCRIFQQMRWMAFKTQMTKEEGRRRFGKEKFDDVQLNSLKQKQTPELDSRKVDPRGRADVREIWSKEHKEVFWLVEGQTEVLDRKKDLYKLPGFWPFPSPLIANVTTSKFLPTPFFILARDLYDEIDAVSTRITMLQRVIKAAALYDKSAGESVGRLFREAGPNEAIPIPNWPRYQEKGGLKGLMDWLPLEAIVAAMDKLREYRAELLQMTYQLTGYSDLMRGQQNENGTPGEAGVKVRFASIRLQAAVDRFAKFVSDALRIKAHMIVRFFSDKTLIERSGALFTFDAQDQTVLKQAIQLLRSRLWMYRIEVKPENIAQPDFAELTAERTALITGISQFFLSVAPMVQALGPGSMPTMLRLLKWVLAGLKRGAEVEGLIDQAVQEVQQAQQQAQAQAAQNPQPMDPKVQAQMLKAAAEERKQALQAQIDSAHIDHETQATIQRQEHSATLDIQQAGLEHLHKVEQARVTAALKPKPAPGGAAS